MRTHSGARWFRYLLSLAFVMGGVTPTSTAVADPAKTIGIASDRTGHYWLLRADGTLVAGPDTAPLATAGRAPAPVAVAVTPTGRGGWLVGADGAVVAFGDATLHGSTPTTHLNQPIVGIAPTPDANGYWLVAADGGVFAFGDAPFQGSTATTHLNQPIVAIAPTPDANGYWLAAADGGVFAFGDAAFHGSAATTHLNQPVVGIATTPDGNGYWLAAADGRIFGFGKAPFHGSAANRLPSPVVAITTSPESGYLLAEVDGTVVAPAAPAAAPPTSSPTSTPGPPPSPSPYPSPNPPAEESIARRIFDKDNDERAARGIAAVRWSPELAARASAWSRDQLPRSGADPSGEQANVIGRGGCPDTDPGTCYATAYLPTDGDAHLGWMYSQGHRDNIVDPRVTDEGVGVSCAPNGVLYATEIFTASPSASPQPAATLRPIVHDDNSGLTCNGETRADNGLDRPTASS